MSKRVLFIDDQLEDWEGLLRRGLESFGFDLKGEEDPSKALRIIGSYKPDVVLLDILFPDGYLGKPTLEKIKKKYPNLPVMMITSTMAEDEYRSEDYALADYRYAKAALTGKDCSDLASQLEKIIEKAGAKDEGKKDETGMSRLGFIVGKTKVMQQVAEMVEKVADQEITVLITGESGTGKELVARAIHNLSKRKSQNFLTIVCAAMPKELLESELFGHEKGAFTGAHSQKIGKFEAAGDGTIFLDEIGEMPLETQVKLLRFLQEKQFERVGGNQVISSKARIIAATNQDLQELIKQGKFREDLFFRLNVVSIHIPPLRERKEDIPLFFEHFINKANESSQKKILSLLRDDVKDQLVSYHWPGNIREFQNMVERTVALADENILQTTNFAGLNKANSFGTSNVSDIVDRIYKGELNWEYLKKEFGARSAMRKEVLVQVMDRWRLEHQDGPSSKDLAMLLSVAPGNLRRILSECGISLHNYS